MTRVLKAELLKLRRAHMPVWTLLVVVLYSLMSVTAIRTISRPDVIAAMAKTGGSFKRALDAGMFTVTWTNMLHFGAQGIAGSWGLLTFGLVAAYVFAREFREGTETVMLTAPVRRQQVVVAKIIVVGGWVLALTLVAIVVQTGVIALSGAGGFAWSHLLVGLKESLAASLLIFLTLPLVALFAVWGKGYLRPMLFCLAMMILTNAIAPLAVSRWFPWTMPVDMVGASWLPIPSTSLVPGSWLLALAVFAAGLVALMRQADQVVDS